MREMVIFTKSACSMSQEEFLGNNVFFFLFLVILLIQNNNYQGNCSCLPEPGRWKTASEENKSASGENTS